MRRALLIPAAVAIVVAPLLAGCGPSGNEPIEALATAVVAARPEIQGALVGFSSSGVSLVMSVKAYIPTAERMSPDELATVVEAGLEAVWLATDRDPSFVAFSVVPTVKPADAAFTQRDVGRFPETGKILNGDGGTSDGSFGFDGSTLEQRFGS